MTHEQFWEAMPGELLDRLQTFHDHWDRERQRDAWMLANLLQPWSNQALKASDFWETKHQMSRADKLLKLREIADRMSDG